MEGEDKNASVTSFYSGKPFPRWGVSATGRFTAYQRHDKQQSKERQHAGFEGSCHARRRLFLQVRLSCTPVVFWKSCCTMSSKSRVFLDYWRIPVVRDTRCCPHGALRIPRPLPSRRVLLLPFRRSDGVMSLPTPQRIQRQTIDRCTDVLRGLDRRGNGAVIFIGGGRGSTSVAHVSRRGE